MGLWFDNINITDIKDNLSGISFVIAKRDPKLIGQGLLYPTIKYASGDPLYGPTTEANSTFACPTNFNYKSYLSTFIEINKRLRPYTFTLEAPDLFNDVPTLTKSDVIKIVGHVAPAWWNGQHNLEQQLRNTSFNVVKNLFYTKNYHNWLHITYLHTDQYKIVYVNQSSTIQSLS